MGNTLDVTRGVEEALDGPRARPAGRRDRLRPSSAPPTFIEQSIDNLTAGAARSAACWWSSILVAVPVRLADRADQPARDPAVADRRGLVVLDLRGGDDQHDGPGRPGDRARRGRRRRHHRRREHRPPAAPDAARGQPGRRPSAVVLDASLEVRSAVVYATPDRHRGVPAGLLPRRAVGLVLPAAGARLRAGDARVAAGRADGHAGAVPDAAAGAPSRATASRRWCACCRRAYGARAAAHRRAGRAGYGGRLATAAGRSGAGPAATLGQAAPAELQGERLPDALGRPSRARRRGG